MAKPYSMDLRERVVEGVEREGLSCRQAAARFGVSYSAAIAWLKRVRETGSGSGSRADDSAISAISPLPPPRT